MMLNRHQLKVVRETAENLVSAFSWTDSPQGSEYWKEVHKNLHDLAKACDTVATPFGELSLAEDGDIDLLKFYFGTPDYLTRGEARELGEALIKLADISEG